MGVGNNAGMGVRHERGNDTASTAKLPLSRASHQVPECDDCWRRLGLHRRESMVPSPTQWSSCPNLRLALGMVDNDLAKDCVEGDGDGPVGIVRAEFGEIRNVADVVALAVFIDVVPVQFFASHLFNFSDGFQHGNAVFAASTKVIDFARPRVRRKLFYSANYVVTVDIVTHLFALVAKH